MYRAANGCWQVANDGDHRSDTVERWNGRVLVLAHVKELLEQIADSIRMTYPSIKVGLYSAGLGKRETRADVLVAGIQSVYDKG